MVFRLVRLHLLQIFAGHVVSFISHVKDEYDRISEVEVAGKIDSQFALVVLGRASSNFSEVEKL